MAAKTPAALFEKAFRLHTGGRPAEAAKLYRQVLKAIPGHPRALHLLGLTYHQRGYSAKGLEYLDKAVAGDPGDAEAHNNRGHALKAVGRGAEAIEAFRRAVAIDPAFAGARANLAAALHAGGHDSEAESEFRRALDLDPGLAEAHFTFAGMLLDSGRPAEAHRHLDQAVALRPDFAAAHRRLGVVLMQARRWEDAAHALERAVTLDPALAAAHNDRSVVLRALGRLDAAAAAAERALALRPEMGDAWANLARARRFSAGDQAIHQAGKLLAAGGLSEAAAASAHFALAKMLDDAGEAEAAFAHARAANRALGYRFDATAHDRFIEAAIAAFPPQVARQRPDYAPVPFTPILVLGMPRSGTTLVEQILASHPRAFGAGELFCLRALAEGIDGYPEALAEIDHRTLAGLRARYLDVAGARAGDAGFVVDKTPFNVLHLGLAALIVPEARVVHCRRDPRDVAVSVYFTRFTERQAFSADLGDIARYQAADARLMDHWRTVLDLAILDLDYEDLVADQEGVTRRLLAHCGLDWDPACLEFFATERGVDTPSDAQVRRPMYADSVGRWKRYAPWLESDGYPTAPEQGGAAR